MIESTRITGREAIEIHRRDGETLRATDDRRRIGEDEAFDIIANDPGGVYVDEAEDAFGSEWSDGTCRKTVEKRPGGLVAVYTGNGTGRRAQLQEIPEGGWLVVLEHDDRPQVRIYRRRGLKHLGGMCARWARGRVQTLRVDVDVDGDHAGYFFAPEGGQIAGHIEMKLPGWKIGWPVYAVPHDSQEVMSGPVNRVRVRTEPR